MSIASPQRSTTTEILSLGFNGSFSKTIILFCPCEHSAYIFLCFCNIFKCSIIILNSLTFIKFYKILLKFKFRKCGVFRTNFIFYEQRWKYTSTECPIRALLFSDKLNLALLYFFKFFSYCEVNIFQKGYLFNNKSFPICLFFSSCTYLLQS